MKKHTTYMLTTALVFILFGSTNAFAQHTDFSGNWTINMQKSEFGDIPTYAANKAIKVTQFAEQLILERTTTTINDESKDSTSVQRLSLKGDSALIPVANHTVKKIKLHFFNGGKTLRESTIVYDSNGETLGTITTDWSLSADKKMLTMILSVEGANGSSYSVTAIYDRE